MILENLTATSPIDGRYRNQTVDLSNYFSEFALIKYRILIEIEYFIFLHQQKLAQFSKHAINEELLRNIYKDFSIADAETIKNIEKTTNHDVKAVEYFIKQKLEILNLSETSEFVHFGLTSQDINNTAIPLSIKDALTHVILPNILLVLEKIKAQANEWAEIPMLAKTHGQPASPTKLGKEWMVFASRMNEQIKQLNQIPFSAKFGGATGNFNAHHLAYPTINWHEFSQIYKRRRFMMKSPK